MDQVCNAYRGVSAVECNNAAEASKVLCGSVPGYTGNGVKKATYKEGLVAVSDPGGKKAGGSALSTGSDLEAWRDERRILLRSPSELQKVIALEGRVALHTHPELKRKPRCHARLLRDMSLRGLVSFGPPAGATIGVFMVPKKKGLFSTHVVSFNTSGGHGTVLGWVTTSRQFCASHGTNRCEHRVLPHVGARQNV